MPKENFLQCSLKLIVLLHFSVSVPANCNLPPVFTQDMNNEAFSESTPVGTVVYKLEGYDPESGNVTFGLIDSGNFMVDPQTGEVRIVKALDREVSLMSAPGTTT